MANQEIKQKRMLIYFIEAAQNIINEEGITNITLRKVADAAGYNSATLYHYFHDLDQVILYASLKYLRPYNMDILDRLKGINNELEKYYLMWDSFCDVSFQYPEAFERIFFTKYSSTLDDICLQYYELFPEEIVKSADELYPVLSNFNLETRNKLVLTSLLESEQISLEHLDTISELMVAAYHSLLKSCVASGNKADISMLKDKMHGYVSFILERN